MNFATGNRFQLDAGAPQARAAKEAELAGFRELQGAVRENPDKPLDKRYLSNVYGIKDSNPKQGQRAEYELHSFSDTRSSVTNGRSASTKVRGSGAVGSLKAELTKQLKGGGSRFQLDARDPYQFQKLEQNNQKSRISKLIDIQKSARPALAQYASSVGTADDRSNQYTTAYIFNGQPGQTINSAVSQFNLPRIKSTHTNSSHQVTSSNLSQYVMNADINSTQPPMTVIVPKTKVFDKANLQEIKLKKFQLGDQSGFLLNTRTQNKLLAAE